MTVTASCHCGAISIEMDAAPQTVTECNCSICRRYGALWAYCHPSTARLVPADAPTDAYQCNDRSQHFHRCKTCGCITHWASLDPNDDTTGINARLLPPEILNAARLRHLDGADTWKYLDG